MPLPDNALAGAWLWIARGMSKSLEHADGVVCPIFQCYTFPGSCQQKVTAGNPNLCGNSGRNISKVRFGSRPARGAHSETGHVERGPQTSA